MSEWVSRVREALERRGPVVEPGLTGEEIALIEQDLGFRFPADLREMLMAFLPSGPGFPSWRNHESPEILDWLDRPAEEIEMQVLEEGFWIDSWGERPDDDEDAADVARGQVSRAPVLIPVWDECYIPALPREAGNPIFSVPGAGVAIVAPDLVSFLSGSLELELPATAPGAAREIVFWSELAEL